MSLHRMRLFRFFASLLTVSTLLFANRSTGQEPEVELESKFPTTIEDYAIAGA
jgi:hypothetical protein